MIPTPLCFLSFLDIYKTPTEYTRMQRDDLTIVVKSAGTGKMTPDERHLKLPDDITEEKKNNMEEGWWSEE